MNAEALLTTAEAARYYGVGLTKLRQMMNNGLRYTKLGYRTIRFKREWLDDYADKGRGSGSSRTA